MTREDMAWVVRLVVIVILVLTNRTQIDAAQSLAAAAAKAEQQRSGNVSSGSPKAPKVYTNKDLVPSPAPARMPETTAPHPAPAVEAPRVIPVDAPKDEQWWKSQMRALETQYDHDLAALSLAKKHVEDLRARLTPSENRLRGIGEALKPTQIEVARSEVARLEVVASNSKAAVERLREDARRASVPPGWLRWP